MMQLINCFLKEKGIKYEIKIVLRGVDLLNVDFSYIIGPLIGGIIGLITNGIAIRMLFRPLHPIKIFNHTLPFTPGIIPKEKARIAKSCGDVVGEILINESVLSENLLSVEMDNKISGFLDHLVDDYKESTLTVQDVLCKAFDTDRTDAYIEKAQTGLIELIYKKACSLDLGASVAEAAIAEVQKNPLYSTFSFLISEDAVVGMKEKIRVMVDDMVFDQGKDLISEAVVRESDGLLHVRLVDLYEDYGHKVPIVKERILGLYHTIVQNSLAKILQAVDLSKLVEDRINGFDVLELEHILLGIMKKELNAIVWLGGLLGLIMGFIMNFF